VLKGHRGGDRVLRFVISYADAINDPRIQPQPRSLHQRCPLPFQRQIRLMEARKLLSAGSTNVSRVAYDLGYASPSQFSREYKSMFGSAPVADLPR
jgi:AraC-type DNA-binding domain-containing proteins